jgi:putative membrane protein
MLAAAAATESPWAWHPHPDVWLLIFVLTAGYIVAVIQLGPKLAAPGEVPATQRQKGLFFLGILALWIGADWPIHDISENYLFSVHMVQHTIFSLVAPPLLLAGTPSWLLRAVLRPRWLMALVRRLARPFVALLFFNAVIAVTHWSALVDLSLRSEGVHFLVHTVLVLSSVIMWIPVLEPLPEFKRMSEPGKMLYLFGQSILPTVPASFLTFSSGVIYKFYEEVPRIWGFSAIDDQRVAGLIMKLGGGLLLWSVIAVLFFRWNSKEESQAAEELRWDDFERELEIWNLRK